MKIESIEGLDNFDIIKLAEAHEVEQATASGWRLLGVIAGESSKRSDSQISITYNGRPNFVLAKTSDSVIATLTKERDALTASKKALQMTVDEVRSRLSYDLKKLSKPSLIAEFDRLKSIVSRAGEVSE